MFGLKLPHDCTIRTKKSNGLYRKEIACRKSSLASERVRRTVTLNFSAIVLLLGCAAIVVDHLQSRRLFRSQDAAIQKYKLYKVRDDLIHLVAARGIAEEDPMFTYFYQSIMFVIKRTDILTLRSLLDALRDAKANGLDPAENEFVNQLNLDLSNKAPEVRRVVTEFYQAVLETLLENSWLLRVMVRKTRIRKIILVMKRMLTAVASLFQPLPPFAAYVLYKQYKDAVRRTSHQDPWLAAA